VEHDRGDGQDWRQALPRDGTGRVLFGLAALGLLFIVPMLWMWVRYLSPLSETGIYAGAFAIAIFELALARAMIGMLGER
jgi:hypothetical protein